MTYPNEPNSITFPDANTLPESYFTEYRGHVLRGVGVAFILLEIIAFFLRVVARRIARVPFGWDDALMIPALIFNLGVCITALLTVSYAAAGYHSLVAVKMGMHNLVFLSKAGLLVEPILYTLAVTFSKGAILYFFLRIFRTGYARYTTYALAVIITSHAIAAIVIIMFQCKPLSLLWEIRRTGCEINIAKFFHWNSVPNVITDVVMFVLAMPQIWTLRTSVQMKIGVTITFLTASVGIVTSILRTVAFFQTDLFSDPSWVSVPLLSYTIAEPGTYFLAACFSTYRPLLRYIKNTSCLSRLIDRYFNAVDESAREDQETGMVGP